MPTNWLRTLLVLLIEAEWGQSLQSRGWPVIVTGSFGAETIPVVIESEPLLVATERAGLRPPLDCRRGNCLSCSARLAPDSSLNFRVRGETFLCKDAQKAGYVLLCCTHPIGPGLKLELEKMDEVAHIQYYEQYQGRPHKLGMASSALAMRHWAEDNLERWRADTEVGLEEGDEGGC